MKTLLLLLATFNLNTLDTHSNSYESNPIMIDGLTYRIEEDYSISVEYDVKTMELILNEKN